jgi:hypothetical protein
MKPPINLLPPEVLELAGILLDVGQRCARALVMEPTLMKGVSAGVFDESGAAMITEFFRGAKIICNALEAANQVGAHRAAVMNGEVA